MMIIATLMAMLALFTQLLSVVFLNPKKFHGMLKVVLVLWLLLIVQDLALKRKLFQQIYIQDVSNLGGPEQVDLVL